MVKEMLRLNTKFITQQMARWMKDLDFLKCISIIMVMQYHH